MATFSAVNTALSPPETSRLGEEHTPTTPKPISHFTQQPSNEAAIEDSTLSTPTRDSFGGISGQRPLPDELVTTLQTQGTQIEAQESLKRDSLHLSTTPEHSHDAQDVEMGEGEENDEDVSDNDSVTSDSQRPSKKKKGQRFFCTDFPPCQLSFTRSEHLARHIRYVAPAVQVEL